MRAGERDPFVDAVLAEEGLTLGEPPAAARWTIWRTSYFDLIVTLAPEAHHAALELTRSMAVEVEYWPTPDPTAATGHARADHWPPIATCATGSTRAFAARFGAAGRRSE